MEFAGSGPMAINRKRGLGSSWTVAPAEGKKGKVVPVLNELITMP
jgi:L-aminopeptidase/D-esterase-like protein